MKLYVVRVPSQQVDCYTMAESEDIAMQNVENFILSDITKKGKQEYYDTTKVNRICYGSVDVNEVIGTYWD